MAKPVDAVIDALKIVLQEAEMREDQPSFDVAMVNRWIARLPAAWLGRWRHLRLPPEYDGGRTADREDFISHIRATLAYLENYRNSTSPRRLRSWSRRQGAEQAVSKPREAKIIALPGNKHLH